MVPLRFFNMPILACLTLVEGAIHDITLTATTRTEVRFGRKTGSSSNVGHRLPFRHGFGAVEMGGGGGAAGARWNEKIADGREDIHEPLQVPGRSKSLHHPLSPPERQMRILRSIVLPLMRAVIDVWHDLALGSSVGTELVSDHSSWRAALFPQEAPQQALGCRGIAARLHDLIKDVSVLVSSPPKPVLLAG